ncbi:MAG: hypothetical protein ABI388_11960 [Bacteroidia bacterium]
MKKIICLAVASAIVIISACSPKANKAVAATTPATPPSSSVTVAQVDAAKTKYPDATLDALKQGYDVYHGAACTSCHGAKKISNFSAEELPGIIDEMAHKAKISPAEKDAVLKYVMGVRLAIK